MVSAVDIKRSTQDDIEHQLPAHIVESYPLFVQFLKGYYEWLGTEGSPQHAIKNHLDYLSFTQSLDDYIDFMQREYLSKIPKDIADNRELFIKWSKKFNLSRGSVESYKFLFRMLYDDEDVDIYLPKDAILRTSDGKWVSSQLTLLVTNTDDNPEKFLYKRIEQKNKVFDEYYEYASAVVDSVKLVTLGGFNLVELTVTDIHGTFVFDSPVYDQDGNEEELVRVITDFVVENGGQNYAVGDRVEFQSPPYQNEYVVPVVEILPDGRADTKITTILTKAQIEVTVDQTVLLDSQYNYDGRYIESALINAQSEVSFKIFDIHPGRLYVKEVDPTTGEILKIAFDTPVIGIQETYLPLQTTEDEILEVSFGSDYIAMPVEVTKTINGSGFQGIAIISLIQMNDGYYADDKGQLSANIYLQDSNYYQDYSYEIISNKGLVDYAEYVKQVLHPGGFKLFGRVRLLDIIECIIGVIDDASGGFIVETRRMLATAFYSLGTNYLWYGKVKWPSSPRVYVGDEFDEDYVEGDLDYALEDKSLERTYVDGTLENINVIIDKLGWMTKQAMVDADVLQPENYFEHNDYDYLYAESSYISTAGMSPLVFINKYVDLYHTDGYCDYGSVQLTDENENALLEPKSNKNLMAYNTKTVLQYTILGYFPDGYKVDQLL